MSEVTRMLAAGQRQSGQRSVEITVYKLQSGDVVAELRADESPLSNLQFSRDARFLVNPGGSNSDGFGRLVVWSIANEEEVFSLKDFRSYYDVVATSMSELAVSGYDFVSFVNPIKGEVRRWERVPGVVWDLAVSPDDKVLASTGWDGMVRFWDLPRKENPETLSLQRPTTALCFSPSGDILATDHRSAVVLRDPDTFESMYTLYGHRQPVFSPDGDRLATLSGGGSAVQLWDYRSGLREGPPITFGDSGIGALAFARKGDLLGCALTSVESARALSNPVVDHGSLRCLRFRSQWK